MSKTKKKSNLLEEAIIRESLKQSFLKLNPAHMARNPVMFTVEIGTAVMIGVCYWVAMGEKSQGSLAYNIAITLIL
ncbi:MAG TPA: hypothetical protein VG847_05540, partial [Chitinophagaceae bacterium]|nr:hypothetical protein [Chitinophagaceae bacterium]